MAETNLTIANRALGQCGARASIVSFAEDSNEARAVAQNFDNTVAEVLSAARWNFAKTTAEGVQLAPPTSAQWRYAYTYPADCLRLSAVFRKGQIGLTAPPIFPRGCGVTQDFRSGRVSFSLGRSAGQRAILANEAAVIIEYIQPVTDFGQWDPMAISALEYMLAGKLALPLSGDKTLAKMMAQIAQEKLTAAAVADATHDLPEDRQDIPAEDLLVRDRGEWPGMFPFNWGAN